MDLPEKRCLSNRINTIAYKKLDKIAARRRHKLSSGSFMG